MTEQGMRLRIGVFVLISLVLLVSMVVLFGSFPSLFQWRSHYIATFPDAPHVVPGTPVRRCGVRIGEVERVELDDDKGGVRIHLLIDKRYHLRRNERPKLAVGLIGGDTSIELVSVCVKGQQPDRSPLPPGETLEGLPQANVSSLLSGASEVVPTTQGAVSDARRIMQRFERVMPLMEDTVREYRDLAKATREMVPELRHTNDDLRGLVKSVRESVPNLNRTNDEVCELVKAVRETVPDLTRTNTEIQTTIRNWGKVGDRVDGLLQTNQDRIAQVCTSLQNSLERLARVLNDDNLRNLDTVLKNVRGGTELLEDITRNTDEMIKDSRLAIHKISDTVAKTDETMNNMQQATKPFADRSDRIMKNLDESTDKLNKTMTEARELMRLLEKEDGTLRRLIADPSVYNRVDELLCLAIKLMPHVDRILCDFELFADKVARHPELFGIGGVVNPSTGIKR